MRKEIRIAGSGGQGVILGGILLSYSIGIFEGLEVVQTQSYGPESRGGACRAELIVGDEKIDYVKVELPDCFVAMNEISFRKYGMEVKPDSLVIVDSSLVTIGRTDGSMVRAIPAKWLAENKLKSYVANMVILGAFARVAGFVSLRSMIKAVEQIIPAKHQSINKDALSLGHEWMGG